MNLFSIKLTAVLLLLLMTVAVYPFEACAAAINAAPDAAHPCCPPGHPHGDPGSASDCTCITCVVAETRRPMLSASIVITAVPDLPVAQLIDTLASGPAVVATLAPSGYQRVFVIIHQFRI